MEKFTKKINADLVLYYKDGAGVSKECFMNDELQYGDWGLVNEENIDKPQEITSHIYNEYADEYVEIAKAKDDATYYIFLQRK